MRNEALLLGITIAIDRDMSRSTQEGRPHATYVIPGRLSPTIGRTDANFGVTLLNLATAEARLGWTVCACGVESTESR